MKTPHVLIANTLGLLSAALLTTGCTSHASDDGFDLGDGKADGTSSQTAKTLSNGHESSIGGQGGKGYMFKFDVPDGQTYLHVETKGNGDSNLPGADLFLKFGAPPTRTQNDFKSILGGSDEDFSPPPLAGTWYALVAFGNDVDDATINATWNTTDQGTQVLDNGATASLGDVESYDNPALYFPIPAGGRNLHIEATCSDGDPKICIGKNQMPQSSNDVGCIYTGNSGNFGDHRAVLDLANAAGPWLISVSPIRDEAKDVKVTATYE